MTVSQHPQERHVKQSGNYILPLPCKAKSAEQQSPSKKKFGSVDKKLKQDAAYKEEYFTFINELISSGHVEEILKKRNFNP